MGGKHRWAGKHVPLYLAGLIFFSGMACASADVPRAAPVDTRPAAQTETIHMTPIECPPLQHVHLLMSQGDFEGALKESQEVLSRYLQVPPGDEALYAMGLIYAHPGNPKKDLKRSLAFFLRVFKEFPGSPRAEEAKIWVGVLDAIEKSRQVDMQIEEKKQELVK